MKVRSMITIASGVMAVGAIYLAVKKPQPVAQAQAPAEVVENLRSLQEKFRALEKPEVMGYASTNEIRVTSGEASAALAQTDGAPPATEQLSPNTDIGSMPAIQAQQVRFAGDQVQGQFQANVLGKDVWITIAGRLGSQGGYATFDPTEFKIGDMNVPVSLVNGALQKKLEEQRESLKLPDFVGSLRVEDGELVITKK